MTKISTASKARGRSDKRQPRRESGMRKAHKGTRQAGNSAVSPAPRLQTPKELGELAEKMCAAKSPKKAGRLRLQFMEGFYGRHLSRQELQPTVNFDAEDKLWIARIRNGEATEIFWKDKP